MLNKQSRKIEKRRGGRMAETRSRRNKPKRKWLKITAGLLLVLFLGVGAFVFSVYNEARQTVAQKIHEPIESIDSSVGKEKVKGKESINILLLGVDQREDEKGRSDALMVLSLDPADDSMQLISIPRDTRTEIVGRGVEDKINHAYAFGGTDMAVETVENLLEVELDYYVHMNMEGLTEMVDAVGGITVTNELDWVDDGYYEKGFHYAKGPLELNGDQALGYVRMRKQDPAGDFGRTARQRQVIQAVINKGANVASVNKIDDMMQVLGNNMSTNMDFQDMQNLLMGYTDTRKNSESYQLQGTGTTINGIYYLVVSEEEISKVHGMLVN